MVMMATYGHPNLPLAELLCSPCAKDAFQKQGAGANLGGLGMAKNYHPALDNPAFKEILNDLDAAGTQEEWDSCIASLVALLLGIASGEGGIQEPTQMRQVFDLHARITQGFQPPKHRPRAVLQAREDAWLIQHVFHSTDRTNAVAALAGWRKIKADAARHRVDRAVKEAGLKLKPGNPYGKEPGKK